jgi:hypothetical protein
MVVGQGDFWWQGSAMGRVMVYGWSYLTLDCHNGKNPVIAMQSTTSTAIPDPAVMEYMEQQAQQFEMVRSRLFQSHGRQFVWFEAGQVLDADVDFSALCDRVMHFAADRPTFIRQVLPVDPQPIVRS